MLRFSFQWFVRGEGPHKYPIVANTEEEAKEKLRNYLSDPKQAKLLKALEQGDITFRPSFVID